MKTQQSEKTLVVLANASELVCCIAQGVIGNEVADTFNGSPLTREVIYQSAQAQCQKAVSTHTKGN